MRSIRKFIASLLEVKDQEATNGEWWEIDLIIVILLGSFVLGLASLMGVAFY